MLESDSQPKQFKAIYFDRDHTITYFKPEKRKFLQDFILEKTSSEYKLSYDEMMSLFDIAEYPKDGLKSIDAEIAFWKRYYAELLKFFGATSETEKNGQILFGELWCNHDRNLFPEVIEVMTYFKKKGFKIGIISDTSPSLQMTLEQLGLGVYIDSYTCSDLVGAMKPDPRIYQVALDSLSVKAEESFYVDDYDIEADGARDMGFTAFHIDRKGESTSEWAIRSLKEIIEFYEK